MEKHQDSRWINYLLSVFFSIRRTTINQKQTPYTITTEEINVSSENEGFDVDGNFDICNDDNSNMNSNNNISTKKIQHSLWNSWVLNLDVTFNLVRLRHGKHNTPWQIMMENFIYGKTRSKSLTNLKTVGVTISWWEMKKQRRLLSQYMLLFNRRKKTPIPSLFL